MVFCGICKQNKETPTRWTIHEHSAGNALLRDFKICGQCAAFIIRKLMFEMKRENKGDPQLDLTQLGILDHVVLGSDDVLDITLQMDLAKARKIVLEHSTGELATTQ